MRITPPALLLDRRTVAELLSLDECIAAVESAFAAPGLLSGPGVGGEYHIKAGGLLAPGMKADLVVLDMATLQDNTSVVEPNVYPTGVQHVFVNGVAAVKDGQRTLALAGRVLNPIGRPARMDAATGGQ